VKIESNANCFFIACLTIASIS